MDLAERYLDLLKKTLVRWGEDEFLPIRSDGPLLLRTARTAARAAAAALGKELLTRRPFDPSTREVGRDWPAEAVTMMGIRRLQNVQDCVRAIVSENVPGDLVETGVWRGGGSIFMRAALHAYGDTSRLVWCADSFESLPRPDVQKYPQDKDVIWHTQPELAVSIDEVKGNFERFGLLDDRVRFLRGWFKDTLPVAPIDHISILRLDGDMYESTMDALNALYDRVSDRGFIIVDDYGIPEDTCRRAIDDFRRDHDISDPLIDIDGWGAYWRKSSGA